MLHTKFQDPVVLEEKILKFFILVANTTKIMHAIELFTQLG